MPLECVDWITGRLPFCVSMLKLSVTFVSVRFRQRGRWVSFVSCRIADETGAAYGVYQLAQRDQKELTERFRATMLAKLELARPLVSVAFEKACPFDSACAEILTPVI